MHYLEIILNIILKLFLQYSKKQTPPPKQSMLITLENDSSLETILGKKVIYKKKKQTTNLTLKFQNLKEKKMVMFIG